MTEFSIAPETGAHNTSIDLLHASAFGPGRFSRAAFRVREQGSHDRNLSFVALDSNNPDIVLGSVRMTWIETDRTGFRGLLLGPLAVLEPLKGKGIGKALLRTAADAARQSGAPYVLLVGDGPYYRPFGFEAVEHGAVTMPGPVDPDRLLLCPFDPRAAERIGGEVRWTGSR